MRWTRKSIKACITAALAASTDTEERALWEEEREGVSLHQAAKTFLGRRVAELHARAAGFVHSTARVIAYLEKLEGKRVLLPTHGVVQTPGGKIAGFARHGGGTNLWRQLPAKECWKLFPKGEGAPASSPPNEPDEPCADCKYHADSHPNRVCKEYRRVGWPRPSETTCGEHGSYRAQCGCPPFRLSTEERATIKCATHGGPLTSCGCPSDAERVGFNFPATSELKSHAGVEILADPTVPEGTAICVDKATGKVIGAITDIGTEPERTPPLEPPKLMVAKCQDCGWREEYLSNGIMARCNRCDSLLLQHAVSANHVGPLADPDPHVEPSECTNCGHPEEQHQRVMVQDKMRWGCYADGCICDQLLVKGDAGPTAFTFNVESGENPPKEPERGYAVVLASNGKVELLAETTACCICAKDVEAGSPAYKHGEQVGHESCVEWEAEAAGFNFNSEELPEDPARTRGGGEPLGPSTPEELLDSCLDETVHVPPHDWTADEDAEGFNARPKELREKTERSRRVREDLDLSQSEDPGDGEQSPGGPVFYNSAEPEPCNGWTNTPVDPGDARIGKLVDQDGEQPEDECPESPFGCHQHGEDGLCSYCGVAQAVAAPSPGVSLDPSAPDDIRANPNWNPRAPDSPDPMSLPLGQRPPLETECKCGHQFRDHQLPGSECARCACTRFREGTLEPMETPEMKAQARLSYALTFDLERKAKKAGNAKTYRACRLCNKPIWKGEMFTIPKGKGPKQSSGRRAHIDCVKGVIERKGSK